MKKFYLILFMFGLIQSYNHAQQDCKNIGMNLYYNKYWSREMPFADLTKQASQWLDEELKPIDLDSAEFEAVDVFFPFLMILSENLHHYNFAHKF